MSVKMIGGNTAMWISLVIATTLAFGACLAALHGSVFWVMVAIWGLILALFPTMAHRFLDRPSASWIVIFVILPFLVAPFLNYPHQDIFRITEEGYWQLSSIAIFSLSLVTVIYADFYTLLKMNLNFTLLTNFLLFESMIAIQGPIGYYSGLVPGNTDFMVYVILATMSGLFLTFVFYHILKRTGLVDYVNALAEGEGV